MFHRPLAQLTLEDLNSAFETALMATFKRLDYARSAARKAVEADATRYFGEGAFYVAADVKAADEAAKAEKAAADEAAKAAKAAAKEAAKVATKEPEPAKPAIVVNWTDDANAHPIIGTMKYTRHGHLRIEAVGTPEGESSPTLAVVIVDGGKKTVTLRSCRDNAVSAGYREQYSTDKDHKTPSGKATIARHHDEIANALKGKGVADLEAVYLENGFKYDSYSHLNPGMQRMTLGNLLRSKARHGVQILVLGVVIVPGAASGEEGRKVHDDGEKFENGAAAQADQEGETEAAA